MIPRGLSDEGESSCSALIDELAAGKIAEISSYQQGMSWRAGAIAAVVALVVGLGSGWWLGKDTGNPGIVEAELVVADFLSGFDVIEHPVEIVSEGIVKVNIDEAGEVLEVWSELEVEKETIRPIGTNYIIDWVKVDRHEVEVVKSQF